MLTGKLPVCQDPPGATAASSTRAPSVQGFADDAGGAAGYECGLHLDGFDDVHEGDIIEAYEIKEVARTQ
jgi:translation initiation factor IF-2